MSWFCCSGPKYHRRRFWCISARLRQLLKISPHPWRGEAAPGLANLGFQPGPAIKEGILGMHLLDFAWQPESQIHPGGLQSAEWNPTSFPRKIWTLSELPLPFWPQGGLHSAWAWWELRFISAALRVGAQHSWARGTPVPLRGPLSGPLAALLKQSAAAGGARALWAQERAGAHARWRWPPPGSAERCGRGQSSGGWPPGAFRQCPAWMGAAAPCCAARPRWVLAGASEWEALSAAVLACPPARHPRDSAPLPGREGAGARPALSALLVPRGSSGHRAGCRLSGRFWLLILNTVSESGGGGEVLPAAASRPCPYGTAAAPRERAGPGQAGRREPRRRAATCALDARLTGLSRPYLPFPAERWLPGLGSEDVVKEWGCLPRELAMAREDSVRCLRCLLYALNLLFWVSPSKWRLRRASRPRCCPFIRGCGNRGGEAAPWVSLMCTLGQVGLIMRCLKEKRLETCCKWN